MKINLHTHTTQSDGAVSPEESARIYKAAGYDAIALTDHWKFAYGGTLSGLRILSGAEYDLLVGGPNSVNGCHHIVALGCTQPPELLPTASVQEALDEIHRCGGIAVLGHPAWSLNRPDAIAQYRGIDAVEIYNSDAVLSNRPYSGYFADTSMMLGKTYPLLAADDTHLYDGSDETKSYIMLECPEDADDGQIMEAVRQKRFYATQGPEIHIRQEGCQVVVDCSPVSSIRFYSNVSWLSGRCLQGNLLTHAESELKSYERFIRAEVTDAQGRMAWSNFIAVRH